MKGKVCVLHHWVRLGWLCFMFLIGSLDWGLFSTLFWVYCSHAKKPISHLPHFPKAFSVFIVLPLKIKHFKVHRWRNKKLINTHSQHVGFIFGLTVGCYSQNANKQHHIKNPFCFLWWYGYVLWSISLIFTWILSHVSFLQRWSLGFHSFGLVRGNHSNVQAWQVAGGLYWTHSVANVPNVLQY